MQKRTIISGAFLVSALNIIFPPWQMKINKRILDMGYWWITNPPKITNSHGTEFDSEINVTRLLLQVIIVFLFASGLYFAVKKD